MDLGPPISYLVLEIGTPVLTSDGEKLGKVTHVIADAQEELFDGVVIEEHLGHSGSGSPTPTTSPRSILAV